MTNKKYSSKKYGDYPVIIDNDNNVELTLDSVAKLLNDNEWLKEYSTAEYNKMCKDLEYAQNQRQIIESKYYRLLIIVFCMVVILIIETLYLI